MNRRIQSVYNKILKNVEASGLNNGTTFDDQLKKFGKKHFGNKFKGVFSRDKIPNLSKKQPYAIINLDTSNMAGSHWIGLCLINKDKVLVYDSFGVSKKMETIKEKTGIVIAGSGIPDEILKKYPDSITTDKDPEQLPNQTSCGQRSLTFLIICDRYGAKVAKKI